MLIQKIKTELGSMSGHPLINQTRVKTSVLHFSGQKYRIDLSYHDIPDLQGQAVGIKFSDESNSMDSSKQVSVNGMLLGKAIGKRVIDMTSDLSNVSFLGFYLLTDDLERNRGILAVRAKTRLYKAQAVQIHKNVNHKLPQLTQISVAGGVAWGMGERNFISKPQFQQFVTELEKATEVVEYAD